MRECYKDDRSSRWDIWPHADPPPLDRLSPEFAGVIMLRISIGVPKLYSNFYEYSRYFENTRKGNHSSFLTPTWVSGWRPLSLKFALKLSKHDRKTPTSTRHTMMMIMITVIVHLEKQHSCQISRKCDIRCWTQKTSDENNGLLICTMNFDHRWPWTFLVQGHVNWHIKYFKNSYIYVMGSMEVEYETIHALSIGWSLTLVDLKPSQI